MTSIYGFGRGDWCCNCCFLEILKSPMTPMSYFIKNYIPPYSSNKSVQVTDDKVYEV